MCGDGRQTATDGTVAVLGCVVLGTDGVIEVKNERGEIFGSKRLKEVILANRRLPAPDLLERVKAAIVEFHADKFPADDVTLMILERKLG